MVVKTSGKKNLYLSNFYKPVYIVNSFQSSFTEYYN